MTCHKLMASTFNDVFGHLQSAGLQEKITSFGGCFSFRPQRTGTKLSAHSWGIAIDLNPETNAQGTEGNMDPRVIKIFRDTGFEWGGDWQGKVCDPMPANSRFLAALLLGMTSHEGGRLGRRVPHFSRFSRSGAFAWNFLGPHAAAFSNCRK
jgi:D-alanyl-D-alanine carboxypeptidase